MTSTDGARATQARRRFLQKLGQGSATACLGGLFWHHWLAQESRAAPFALRPPGARAEDDFLATCIKCGQCVAACPFDTLRLAKVGGSVPIGTPYFEPRQVPCYLCEDIPCQAACPSGALDTPLAAIDQARMGVAVLTDQEHCLSWRGLRCEICYRECPLSGDAISVVNHPRGVSRHAVFVPTVHNQQCTGCGICEQACPLPEPAIRVFPRALVSARLGEHYRLEGMGESDEPAGSVPPPPGHDALQSGLDYLNDDAPL